MKYLCEWSGVSRSGFYSWVNRPTSARDQGDIDLSAQIKQIHSDSKGIYGSPRVHEMLQQQGICVSRKRVARLMREMGLKGRVVTVTKRQPALKEFSASGENMRLKASKVTGPNQQWVADVTYIRVKKRWRYLAVVMDVYSRRILGWSLGRRRTVRLTLQALTRALKGRNPCKSMIFHTDRGIEYRGIRFQERLRLLGIQASVNRPGTCTDNAHMESFFHSLKGELIRGNVYETDQQLRGTLRWYINYFYNRVRLHSGIDYWTPEAYDLSPR